MLLLFFSQWIPVDGHLDQQDREQKKRLVDDYKSLYRVG